MARQRGRPSVWSPGRNSRSPRVFQQPKATPEGRALPGRGRD